MPMNKSWLEKVPVKEHSGFEPKIGKTIPTIKNHQYFVIDDYSISGDAPKDFIRVYEYGKARKIYRKKWSLYIAKVGHKWYPNESITEYLLNRIGEILGFNIAPSKLVCIGGQIRFLSEYFLGKDQELVHGAEIYSGYLNDPDFVEEVEQKGYSKDFFTIQFTHEAISKTFPVQKDQIFNQFIQMIVFDALVGNNDRHYYNWGVIRHLMKKHQPYFSPIYDTARGLFWNRAEEKIVSLQNDENWLNSYIRKSKPKTGWENEINFNHFDVVKLIAQSSYDIDWNEIKNLLNSNKFADCLQKVNTEFEGILSQERINIINYCLQQRYKLLSEIIN